MKKEALVYCYSSFCRTGNETRSACVLTFGVKCTAEATGLIMCPRSLPGEDKIRKQAAERSAQQVEAARKASSTYPLVRTRRNTLLHPSSSTLSPTSPHQLIPGFLARHSPFFAHVFPHLIAGTRLPNFREAPVKRKRCASSGPAKGPSPHGQHESRACTQCPPRGARRCYKLEALNEVVGPCCRSLHASSYVVVLHYQGGSV